MDFEHVWFWKIKLPERRGGLCRIVARGKMNSILVEFPDGYKVITSRYAVRRKGDELDKSKAQCRK